MKIEIVLLSGRRLTASASIDPNVLGRLLAVHETEGEVDGVVFELPNGNAESFDIRKDVERVSEVEADEEAPEEPQQERKVPTPGPPKHNKEKN